MLDKIFLPSSHAGVLLVVTNFTEANGVFSRLQQKKNAWPEKRCCCGKLEVILPVFVKNDDQREASWYTLGLKSNISVHISLLEFIWRC